jgi:predicted XRE-type DNA-binding protein
MEENMTFTIKKTGSYKSRDDLEQAVLHHFFREHMRQPEIAEITGISKSTITRICTTIPMRRASTNLLAMVNGDVG